METVGKGATFFAKLEAASTRNDSLLCVGLDPDPERMPLPDVAAFNRAIIEATADLVCAYKPNLGFYEALGLAIADVEEVPREGVRVAMIECGESRIELLEATSEESPIARFLERRGPGIHHFCLASSDIRADDAALRAAGYRVLRDEPTRGAGGCWVQFVHPQSTGGVLFELSQPADD